MPIQWFPGHMHKAKKEIAKTMSEVDIVLEVLDARLPMSSANPMVAELIGEKPVLKLLSKKDLADDERTVAWVKFLENATTRVLAYSFDDKSTPKRITSICKELAPNRVAAGRPVRVMIMGIPNVGKSTLINALMGRRIAKVGNEPAVTKQQQRFVTKNDLAIFDTPGILWPKIHDNDSTLRLAASGAIKDTVMDYEEVALFALEFMQCDYPSALSARYKLQSLGTVEETLAEIGKKRGGLRAGGVVDLHKASEVVVSDLRTGKFGKITYETVSEWEEKIRIAELERQEELLLQEEEQKQRLDETKQQAQQQQ